MADVAATVAPNINASGTPSTASSGDADELTVTTFSLVENVGVDDKSGAAVTDLVSSAALSHHVPHFIRFLLLCGGGLSFAALAFGLSIQ